MTIIDRSEWGARHGRGDRDPGPEPRVVIHHSYRPDLSPRATQAVEEASMRAIERWHVENNGWAGIGYNFCVAASGRVYEGRGWAYKGSHAGLVNGSSIGICLLIDGTQHPANVAVIDAVRELIAEGVRLGQIAPDYVVSGHRDHMNRTCPGDKVYAQLEEFYHDIDLLPVVPPITPEVALGPKPRPDLHLDKIFIPRREHVEEIVRRRGLAPDVAEAGLEVAEVLLRGVVAGQKVDVKRAFAKVIADALADWIKARKP